MDRFAIVGRTLPLIGLLTLTLVLSVGVDTAQAVELVAFPAGGTELTVPVSGAVDEVLPLTPGADVDLTEVEVRLVRLARDGVSLPAQARDQLTFSIDPDLLGLRVTVGEDTLTQEGTTTASLLLTITGEDGETQRQLEDLQIVVRPAVLSAPTAVQVGHTVGLFGCWPSCSVDGPPLRIRAAAGTRLTQLLAVPIGEHAYEVSVLLDEQTAEAGGERLVQRQPVALLPPLTDGGVLTLAYELTGSPVLGTQADVVELSSPQLAEPLRITFDVTTRRPPYLIVIVVMFGLGLGWLVRTGLTALSEASARRRDVLEAVAVLQGLRQEIADAAFRNEIDKEIGTLRQARSGAIPDLLVDSKVRVDAAVVKIRQDIDALQTSIEPAVQLLARDWKLEGVIVTALQAARGQAEEVRSMIERGDVSRGTALKEDLDDAVTRLGSEATAELGLMSSAAARLSSALQTSSHLVLIRVQQRARRIVQDCTLPPEADATVALEALQLALADARQLQAEGRHALKTLKPKEAEDPAAFAASAADLRNALRNPPSAALMLDRAATAAGALVAAIGKGRGPSVAAASDEQAKSVGTVPPRVAPARPPALGSRLLAGTQRVSLQLVTGLSELLRWLILAVLLSLLALQWFEPSWIGTFADMMALLTWAFALDVSVEAVRQVTASAPALQIGQAQPAAQPQPPPSQPPPPGGSQEDAASEDPAAEEETEVQDARAEEGAAGRPAAPRTEAAGNSSAPVDPKAEDAGATAQPGIGDEALTPKRGGVR